MKVNKVDLLVNRYLKEGINFKLIKTATTSKIILENGKIVSSVMPSVKLNVWELNLITSVKHYNKEIVFPIKHRPAYINLEKTINVEKTIKDCIEIDLNAAYWNKALELGYINKEIYSKAYGEKISKKARLIALGSLAKTTYIYENKENDLVLTEKKRELTSGIFFHIANEVSMDILTIAYALNTFIFYWVDAIFLQKKEFKKAADLITNFGYEYKFYICEEIEILQDRIIVHSSEHKEKHRIFFKNKKTI